MIDHIVLHVKDLASSREFYGKALAPLGYEEIMAYPEGVGFGRDGKPSFWIGLRGEAHTKVHVAFAGEGRQAVCDFHAAALKAGAQDNGPPGLREMYHPNYYGAFVLDPDGNNIEAVCHQPE